MQLAREFLPIGQLGRLGFWARHLIVLPPALFLCISSDNIVGRPAGLIAAVATTLFLISVWGRRLHDRGRSSAWLLLAIVPVVGAVMLFIECAFFRSTAAAERHGGAPGSRSDYRTV
jgi:uncharacterized membrane protein YhaH (DUF805 family)